MSRHWRPERNKGWAGRRWLAQRGRRGSRVSPGELRLVLLGGVALGLVYASMPGGEASQLGVAQAASTGAGDRVDDPWAVVITDGDTFRYRGDKIRIADIDAPEVRGRCPYETQLAAQATDRMDALLHSGPFELRSVERDVDRYGRKLRVVVRNGRSLGDQLVTEGLARTWSGRREPWC